jgi:hypothetical protein
VSSPVEMIVEAEWGTQFFGPFGKRHHSFGGCSDFFFLRIYLGRGADRRARFFESSFSASI